MTFMSIGKENKNTIVVNLDILKAYMGNMIYKAEAVIIYFINEIIDIFKT